MRILCGKGYWVLLLRQVALSDWPLMWLQRLAQELVASQQNAQSQRVLADSLATLVHACMESNAIDRMRRRNFRRNLIQFLSQVGELLRTKEMVTKWNIPQNMAWVMVPQNK